MNLVEIDIKANDEASGTLDKTGNSADGLKGKLGDLGKAAGLFIGGSGALSVAGALGIAGVAVGAFGAVAGPELSKVQTAMSQTGAAGQKAWADLTPGEQAVGTAIKGVETSFDQLQQKLAPVIDSVVSLGAKTASDLMPALGQLASAGGKVISSFLQPFDAFVKSASFTSLITQMSQLAVQAGNVLGPAFTKLLQVMMQLFVQVAPAGIQILGALLPAITQMVTALTPVVTVVAQVTANILTFLNNTHLLIPVLGLLAAAFLIVAGSSGIGALALAITVVIAAVAYLAQNWTQVWNGIKQVANDVIGWLKNEFNLMPGWLQAPIKAYIDFWKAQWDIAKTVVTAVVDFIKTNWNTIETILEAPIKAAIAVVKTEFEITKTVVTDVVNAVKTTWDTLTDILETAVKAAITAVTATFNTIKGVVSDVVGAIKSVWGAIEGVLEAPFKAAAAVITGVINGIVSVVQGAINLAHELASAVSGSSAPTAPNNLRTTAPGHAAGGIIGAAVGGVQSGLRLVGEQGPELVRLPTGSSVYSNSDTMGMMGGGSQTINIEFSGGQSSFDAFMLEWVRKQVKVQGGTGPNAVQLAFGKR